MSRVLAIDYGEAKTGVAISDEDRKFVFIREPIIEKDPDKLIRELSDIIKEESVENLVIGLPISMSGEENEQAAKVRRFGKLLMDNISVNITYQDERMTTKSANQLLAGNKNVSEDSLAAKLILEDYLKLANV